MELTKLIRVGGVAAILGGALMMVADLWITLQSLLTGRSVDTYEGTTSDQVVSVLFLSGLVLLVVALVGLHARQAEAAGTFGLVGFLAALVGTTLMVGSDWSEVFIAPILAEEAPALMDNSPALLMVGFLGNFVAEAVGWLLFGLATFRAQVFPRAASAALIAAVLLFLAPFSIGFILWEAAIIWLGVDALREKRHMPFANAAGASQEVTEDKLSIR